MKKLQNCAIENCIPTPSSCVEWNGGDIAFLGICNGDSLNNITWEIVTKLKELAGEDISTFDLDGLIGICNQKAPQDVTLSGILTLLKNNQICLKEYSDTLNDKLNELFKDQKIEINLKCYSDFDNLGNALSISRVELDQLIIDNLCSHKLRLDTVEGKVTLLQSEIRNIDVRPSVEEPSFATCTDPGIKSTSAQVVAVSTDLCALKVGTGTPGELAIALSKTPSTFNTKFGLIAGWDSTPANLAESYGNLLLAFNNLLTRVELMETTCCSITCKDVEIGMGAIFNENKTAIIVTFNSATGTFIPTGMTNNGSKGTITDSNGNKVNFLPLISNNYSIEVPITGLNLNGPLTVHVDAVVGNASLQCSKCIDKTVTSIGCQYCELKATGTGRVIVVYEVPTTIST